MLSHSLLVQLRFAEGSIRLNLAGLSAEDTDRTPAGEGNSIRWVLGHVLYARSAFHRMLGLEPPLTPAEHAPFVRGSDGSLPADALSTAELLVRLGASQTQLVAALERVSPEHLASEMEKPAHPMLESRQVGQNLAAFAFHEAYHAGQLGLLRRALGHAGAIA